MPNGNDCPTLSDVLNLEAGEERVFEIIEMARELLLKMVEESEVMPNAMQAPGTVKVASELRLKLERSGFRFP